MPFMLKIRWDIKDGSEADFRANQERLCAVMLEHPGVITYHVEYPSAEVSEWTEIYATDAAFKAHLDNEAGKAPLGAVVAACDTITCRCFGDPNDESKEHARRLRDHLPRHRRASLRAQPTRRQGLAGLATPPLPDVRTRP